MKIFIYMADVKFSFLLCIVYCSENRLKINITPNGDLLLLLFNLKWLERYILTKLYY